MNAIEAYQASTTCVCGGIPYLDQSSDYSEARILCQSCGMASPICQTPEQAVNHWNMNIEAMTTTTTVTDIMCRNNPQMAELLGKKPERDPTPVIEAAKRALSAFAWLERYDGFDHHSQAVTDLRDALGAYDNE